MQTRGGILLLIHITWLLCIETQIICEWKSLQFAYKHESERQADIRSGIYDPHAPGALDVDVYYNHNNDRLVFVSIPKFGPGVPATFGIVTNKRYDGDLMIQPFPAWKWHRNSAECSTDRLVSVYRVKIDYHGLLWILDSGNEGNGVICNPQLLAFDLNEWPKVKTPCYRYEFPSTVYDHISIFVTPIVQTQYINGKIYGFAYIADVSSRTIVVTNLGSKVSLRISHESMHPEALFSNYNISGDAFVLEDGVLGMALSPDGKFLFYSALSGSRESRISTYDLKNGIVKNIYTYPTPRKSQSAPMAINKNGIAFFGLVSNITLNCWNIKSADYGKYIHTVYSDRYTMQFLSGVKVITHPRSKDEELWVMTDRIQKTFLASGYNSNEINFRIFKFSVDSLEKYCYYPNY